MAYLDSILRLYIPTRIEDKGQSLDDGSNMVHGWQQQAYPDYTESNKPIGKTGICLPVFRKSACEDSQTVPSEGLQLLEHLSMAKFPSR